MNSKYVYAFAGLMLGLTACSNEDLTSQSGKYNGETVFVSLNVDRSNGGTRTIIEEVDAEGGVGLSNVWAKGDQVTLVSKAGVVAGTLTLEGEGGSSDGIFSGEATIDDGEYTVWYLGDARDGNPPYASLNENGQLVNALATAGCSISGKWDDLNKGDLMNSTVQIIVKDGKATVAESVTLEAQMAMAHFTLSMDGLEDALSAEGASLKLAYTVGETPYSYSITNQSADVYVPLIPGTYAPSFTLTSGEKTYSYAFKNTTVVNAGVYYCGVKNATTGKSDGISVTLKDPTEQDPYEGYENEDPNNPLHKFAKYNLVRVGERGSLTNGFASSDEDNGGLYQWGRNYGFMPTQGMYEDTQYASILTEKYSHWLDAFGYISYNWDEYYSNPEYYIYNPTNTAVVCGVSGHFNNNFYWADAPNTYTTADELKSHPTSYVMDGNPVGATDDYWITNAFGNGGSTWGARATACGYDKTDPCPDGWRLPTETEFRSILPEKNIELRSRSLTNVTTQADTQIRTYGGFKYAIRWIYNGDILEIQARVVADSFTKNQITSDFWSSTEVVSRKFPFTGFIDNVTGCNRYVEVAYDGRGYYALPYHRNRTVNIGIWPVNVGHDGVTYPITYEYVAIRPGENYGYSIGCYWISDGKRAVKFSDRQSFESTSYLLIEPGNPVMGYAIRPVMDK